MSSKKNKLIGDFLSDIDGNKQAISGSKTEPIRQFVLL
jgi:hypothetical protein